MNPIKIIDFHPGEVVTLWEKSDAGDALPDTVAQIFTDRIGSYLEILTSDSNPHHEPYRGQLLDIFSAYGWLLRLPFREDLAPSELIQIIATPSTLESVCKLLEDKILTLSRPLSAQDAIEGWNYIEDRFFLGTAWEGLYILQELSHKPDSCLQLPSHFSQTLDDLLAKISQVDFQIRRLARSQKFSEWNEWLFSLQKMAGRPIIASRDRWLIFLAQKLTPVEESQVTTKDLTFLASNLLSGWIADEGERKNFAQAVAEIAEYEMPVDEPTRQEIGSLNMKTGEKNVPLLFKTDLWYQLVGTCILLSRKNFQKIKEKIDFDFLWSLFGSLFEARWQEEPKEEFILQSRIAWPASASQIYDKMKEAHPDFMMNQEEFEKDILVPLCEMEIFSIVDSKTILYCPNIESLSRLKIV